MATSRSAREFLDRTGIIFAPHSPSQRLDMSDLVVRTYPIDPPLPLPELVRDEEGAPAPDRGAVQPWPIVIERLPNTEE